MHQIQKVRMRQLKYFYEIDIDDEEKTKCKRNKNICCRKNWNKTEKMSSQKEIHRIMIFVEKLRK